MTIIKGWIKIQNKKNEIIWKRKNPINRVEVYVSSGRKGVWGAGVEITARTGKFRSINLYLGSSKLKALKSAASYMRKNK